MTERTRNGIVERCKDAKGRVYFRGRLILQDGSLSPRITIPEEKRHEKRAAKNYVAFCQEAEDATHAIYFAGKKPSPKEVIDGETCGAWFERYCVYRRTEVSTVVDDERWWRKWIAPHLALMPIRAVTSDEIENVRDALSAAVLAYEAGGSMRGEGRLAAKSARNVWTVLTTAMKYASTPKGPRELRVRQDLGNPCTDVPPPRDGSPKRRHWCRPAWIDAALASPANDRSMREAVAIGIYLHLRPGELHELRVKDLDLAVREVRIARAFDEVKGLVKLPKTNEGIRTVTIPETLMPLLERVAGERAAEDRVAPWLLNTHPDFRARLYREFLRNGGVPEEILTETATYEMIDFRSMRDTGITWRFLAGHRIEAVQREAGHERFETTLGYAKEVEDRRNRYGAPFAPLPPDLVAGKEGSAPTGHDRKIHEPIHQESKPQENRLTRRASSPSPHDAAREKPPVAVSVSATDGRLTTRDDVERDPVDPCADPIADAMERELARARAERRWVDADEIARDLEAHRAAIRSPVIDLAARRARK